MLSSGAQTVTLNLKKEDKLGKRTPETLKAHVKNVKSALSSKSGSVTLGDLEDVSKRGVDCCRYLSVRRGKSTQHTINLVSGDLGR